MTESAAGRVFVRGPVPGETDGWFERHWGDRTVVGHGTVYTMDDVECLVADDGGRVVGAVTFRVEADAMEVVTVDADVRRRGIGQTLLHAAVAEADRRGVRRVWLTTTNDNLTALGFYQAAGFRLCALRPDAVAASRRLKPSMPLVGEHGLPLRDELDLELILTPEEPRAAP
jgi:ribosomal protein S18 acetylase RimI-like enzyme